MKGDFYKIYGAVCLYKSNNAIRMLGILVAFVTYCDPILVANCTYLQCPSTRCDIHAAMPHVRLKKSRKVPPIVLNEEDCLVNIEGVG